MLTKDEYIHKLQLLADRMLDDHVYIIETKDIGEAVSCDWTKNHIKELIEILRIRYDKFNTINGRLELVRLMHVVNRLWITSPAGRYK